MAWAALGTEASECGRGSALEVLAVVDEPLCAHHHPLAPVVVQRAGDSTLGYSGGQRASGAEEDVLERMAGGQQQAHATRVAHDSGADLEQADANGGGASARQFGALQGQPT